MDLWRHLHSSSPCIFLYFLILRVIKIETVKKKDNIAGFFSTGFPRTYSLCLKKSYVGRNIFWQTAVKDSAKSIIISKDTSSISRNSNELEKLTKWNLWKISWDWPFVIRGESDAPAGQLRIAHARTYLAGGGAVGTSSKEILKGLTRSSPGIIRRSASCCIPWCEGLPNLHTGDGRKERGKM